MKVLAIISVLTVLYHLGEAQSKCTCGVKNGSPNTRIVGGAESGVNEYPWRAGLFKAPRTRSKRQSWWWWGLTSRRPPSNGRPPSNEGSSRSRGSYFCAGSVISNRWILTAAHCVRSMSPSSLKIGLGLHDLKRDEPNSMVVGVSRIISHPQYNTRTMENDIALVEMDKTVTFTRTIAPVCLPPTPLTENCEKGESGKVMASGWGVTTQGGAPATKNQEVELDLITRSRCDSQYKDHITTKMVCTETTGKDTCQGDSGGGLDCLNSRSKKYSQIGVVSFGDGCAKRNKAGVYTKVSEYNDWIRSQVGRSDPCPP